MTSHLNQDQQLGSDFIHSPLNPSKAEIRLVQVLPGVPSSIIRCKLRHVALDEDHVCLSYVCGDDVAANVILLNDQPYRIRNNLFHFLKTARADGNLDWLWIDSICIDQIKIPERNRQVQQMASIYGTARHVLIWLGLGDDLSQRALSLVGILGNSGWWHDRDKWYNFQNKISLKVSQLFWEAFLDVHWNRYWGRLWVIQEMLQSKDATLCLGTARCALLDYVWFGLGVLEDRIIDDIPDSASHFADVERGNLTLHNLRMLKAVSRSWKRLSKQQLLAELFDFYGHLLCSDKHDKIFGIVSCARNGSEFEVNYDNDLLTLFFRTLAFCQDSGLRSNSRLVQKLWSEFGLKRNKPIPIDDLCNAQLGFGTVQVIEGIPYVPYDWKKDLSEGRMERDQVLKPNRAESNSTRPGTAKTDAVPLARLFVVGISHHDTQYQTAQRRLESLRITEEPYEAQPQSLCKTCRNSIMEMRNASSDQKLVGYCELTRCDETESKFYVRSEAQDAGPLDHLHVLQFHDEQQPLSDSGTHRKYATTALQMVFVQKQRSELREDLSKKWIVAVTPEDPDQLRLIAHPFCKNTECGMSEKSLRRAQGL